MHSVKINRHELLKIVIDNKAKHIAEYLEAVVDYKNLVLQLAQANLKLAKTADLAKFTHIKGVPPAPQSHEDAYKRAIRMLELSVEDIIEVEENIFNQLVLDEWTWKHQFAMTNAMYKSAASGF